MNRSVVMGAAVLALSGISTVSAAENKFCLSLHSVIGEATSGFPGKGAFSPPLEDFPDDPGDGKSYQCGSVTIGDPNAHCQISIGDRDEDEISDMILIVWKMNDRPSATAAAERLLSAMEKCELGAFKTREHDSERSKWIAWRWNTSSVEITLRASSTPNRFGTSNSVVMKVKHVR
jgi:hypothetical protein